MWILSKGKLVNLNNFTVLELKHADNRTVSIVGRNSTDLTPLEEFYTEQSASACLSKWQNRLNRSR